MKKKFVSTLLQTRNEGRAEGKAEGRAEALLRQISRRFGTPDEHVAERVRLAGPADLDRWTDRILDAKTLADVFAN